VKQSVVTYYKYTAQNGDIEETFFDDPTSLDYFTAVTMYSDKSQ